MIFHNFIRFRTQSVHIFLLDYGHKEEEKMIPKSERRNEYVQ